MKLVAYQFQQWQAESAQLLLITMTILLRTNVFDNTTIDNDPILYTLIREDFVHI